MAPRPKTLCVLTQEYSGSTILAYVLATHPEVVTLGEGQKFYLKAVRQFSYDAPEGTEDCSCGEPFAACPFWQSINRRISEEVPARIRALNFTQFRFYHRERPNRLARKLALRFAARGRARLLPPPVGRRYRALAAANLVVARSAMEAAGSSVYLDTGKDPVSTILLARAPRSEGRILHLVRDGRGQVFSTLRYRPNLSFEQACERWLDWSRTHLGLLDRLRGGYRFLRYEDFCAEPLGSIRPVFEDSGLDPNLVSLDFRGRTQHIMGNRGVRFGDSLEIRDKQEWRSAFTTDQLTTFERIGGEMNRRFGYE